MKALNVTAKKHKEANICHKFYPFTILGMHGLSIWQCDIGSSILMLASQIFWIGQSLFFILQSLTRPVNLSIWMLVGAIRIISFFSFWELDNFADRFCSKNLLSDIFSYSSLTQLIISVNKVSLKLELVIDPGYTEKSQPKIS